MMAWELTNAKNIANGNYTNHKFDALMGDKSKEEFVKGVIAIEVESAYNEVLTQLDLSEKTPYSMAGIILARAERHGFVLSEGVGMDPKKQLEYRKEAFMEAYSEYMYEETRLKELYGQEYDYATGGGREEK